MKFSASIDAEITHLTMYAGPVNLMSEASVMEWDMCCTMLNATDTQIKARAVESAKAEYTQALWQVRRAKFEARQREQKTHKLLPTRASVVEGRGIGGATVSYRLSVRQRSLQEWLQESQAPARADKS
jgi:hypothetical protein